MSDQRMIGVTFTADNEELHEWAVSQAKKRPMPVAWFVIEALTAYRQLQSHGTAQGCTVGEWLERASVVMQAPNRYYRTLERDDGSTCVYYTLEGDPAHYVVYDTLDEGAK